MWDWEAMCFVQLGWFLFSFYLERVLLKKLFILFEVGLFGVCGLVVIILRAVDGSGKDFNVKNQ